MNILDEIVEKRKKDISQYGMELGFDVPQNRLRKITPFMQAKGAILEIKRASPSKGDIALNLIAIETARKYSEAGAKAISVLTETHYFKGNLDDLKNVCKAVDSFEKETGLQAPAVLRKDFLLYPEEIDVAYKCGADAVLLIARILDDNLIVQMAKKCETLGITAFLKLRLDDDLRKLGLIAKNVNSKNYVCGVNARDLKDFSIDLLMPSGMLTQIRKVAGKDVRVIFESGIRSPFAAAFAGSMGFSGILLGEAVAKNPDNAKAFVKAFTNSTETLHSKKCLELADLIYKKNHLNNENSPLKTSNIPFIKICGITNTYDAIKASKLGADFIGFIFCAKSKRNISLKKVCEIKKAVCNKKALKPYFVAVITEIKSEEAIQAIQLLKEGSIDFVQLHGFDCANDFINEESLRNLPHYSVVNLNEEKDFEKVEKLRLLGEARIMIDSKIDDMVGGTGVQIQNIFVQKIRKKMKLWLAGGIKPENVKRIIDEFQPELIDISSGIEVETGKKDFEKMKSFFQQIKQ